MSFFSEHKVKIIIVIVALLLWILATTLSTQASTMSNISAENMHSLHVLSDVHTPLTIEQIQEIIQLSGTDLDWFLMTYITILSDITDRLYFLQEHATFGLQEIQILPILLLWLIGLNALSIGVSIVTIIAIALRK